MRIGIISDTHGLLREEVLRGLERCDYIFHAGDICDGTIISKLESIAPLFAVRGNNDIGKWAKDLPDEVRVELDGKRFYMAHDLMTMDEEEEADFIICGHSHKFRIENLGDKWLVNPGSCGRRRFRLPLTWLVMELEEGEVYFYRQEIEEKA